MSATRCDCVYRASTETERLDGCPALVVELSDPTCRATHAARAKEKQ